MPIDRRTLLKAAAGLGATSLLGCSGSSSTSSTRRPAPGAASSSTIAPGPSAVGATGRLVVVTLAGGNDAANTVAPVLDDRYRSARGALALDPATAHDVGEGFALHPALAATKARWDAGEVAVVHGVGFAGLDRSHFHCMDVWQAGDEQDLTTGWVGRWLDLADGDAADPLAAVVVGDRLPLLGRGARRAAAVVPVGPFELVGGDTGRSLLTTLSGTDGDRPPLAGAVAATVGDLLDIVDRVGPVLASRQPTERPTLGDRLDVVADLLDADLPTRVFAVELGGFDTHAQQADVHAALLAELDAGLDAFLTRAAAHDVTVMAYSEFGRRLAANASDGTDHGAAGTVLLAGTVTGGHRGDPPPLDALVDGDLATTTDLRTVLADVIEDVLAVPATDLLP